MNALPDWPLMAVLVHHVQQLDAQREIITNKSVWHLSDEAIKNVCKCFSIDSFTYSNWSMIYVLKLYDEMLKNFPLVPFCFVDAFYIMFTCWGCLFFGSTKV